MEFLIVSFIFGISNFFEMLNKMKCWNSTSQYIIKSHFTVLLTTISPIILLYLINISFVQIINLKDKKLFKYSDKLSDIFCYVLWFFIFLNFVLILFGCFHYIFIEKLEKKLIISKINQNKMSIWIKIRVGFEANSKFKKNHLNATKLVKNNSKYLIMPKKHRINCNLHFRDNKIFKTNKENNIIIF